MTDPQKPAVTDPQKPAVRHLLQQLYGIEYQLTAAGIGIRTATVYSRSQAWIDIAIEGDEDTLNRAIELLGAVEVDTPRNRRISGRVSADTDLSGIPLYLTAEQPKAGA